MDPDSSILGSWQLWLLFALILASAFFSASETALMSVNRLRLRASADQGMPRALLLSRLLEVPNKFIAFLTRVLSPIVAMFNALSNWIAKLFGSNAEVPSRVTEEEIQTLINLGQEEGVLDEHEHSLIRSIFDFGETTAEEVMVPRIDIVAIPVEATIEELGEYFAENPYARLPVYDGSLDNIVGSVHMKDYIRNAGDPRVRLREIIRPVLFVPETLAIEAIFGRMKRQRISTAIVLDEYGQTVGMITPTDITEEIMGNFMDEHDGDPGDFVTFKEGAVEVDGGYLIEDLNEECGFDIPLDTAINEYKTNDIRFFYDTHSDILRLVFSPSSGASIPGISMIRRLRHV